MSSMSDVDSFDRYKWSPTHSAEPEPPPIVRGVQPACPGAPLPPADMPNDCGALFISTAINRQDQLGLHAEVITFHWLHPSDQGLECFI